jgi:hypothetical protein
MFNFGTLGYAGTATQECPTSMLPTNRQVCLETRQARLLAEFKQKKKANKKAKKAAKSAKQSQIGWTPLMKFEGVAPSAQNNRTVSGAYEFFRSKGLSYQAAVTKALQSTQVPSRWRAHYRKYLGGKYKGASKPQQKPAPTIKRRPAPFRPPRRRFRASVASEAPAVETMTEYAPQAAPVSETPMMSLPVAVDEEVYVEDYAPPFYQQPAVLLVGAGLLGAALYLYGKKKG